MSRLEHKILAERVTDTANQKLPYTNRTLKCKGGLQGVPVPRLQITFLLLSPKPPKNYCHSNYRNSTVITVYSPVICQ
jgi:hypothetical protein